MISKDLDSLTKNELGKLFPVIIAEPNSDWKKLFEIEKKILQGILGQNAIRIEHFGSTAIPNLEAKPTIDILVEIPNNDGKKEVIIKKMKSENYHYIQRKDSPPPYIMVVKGYTNEGIKGQSFHIHMAEKEHKGLWDRIYFRDYLIENQEIARKYEKLKRELAKKFKYDREAYTEGKSEFVRTITEEAKEKCVQPGR